MPFHLKKKLNLPLLWVIDMRDLYSFLFLFSKKKKIQLYAFQSQEIFGNLKRQRVFLCVCVFMLLLFFVFFFGTSCAKLKLIAFWTPLTDIPRESVQLNGLAVGSSTLFCPPFFNQQCGYCLHSSFSFKMCPSTGWSRKKTNMWNISVSDHIFNASHTLYG